MEKTIEEKESVDNKIEVDTKYFGKLEVSPHEVLHFPQGIFAFEKLKKYILLSTKKNLSFRWLQSIEEKNIAFLVTDPSTFLPGYKPVIAGESLEIIQMDSSQESGLFCIITVPNRQPEKMTINLQGPILINYDRMLAAQFVSEDDSHPVRQPLFELLKKSEAV